MLNEIVSNSQIADENHFVDVSVYSQRIKTFWGMFDFDKCAFHPKILRVLNDDDTNIHSISYEKEKKNAKLRGITLSNFRVESTQFISRQNRYQMTAMDPQTCSDSNKDLSPIMVLKGTKGFNIYQSKNLKISMDKCKSIKPSNNTRSSTSIFLTKLMEYSWLVVTNNFISSVRQKSGFRLNKQANTQYVEGQIVRKGDILRFGMLPVIIREHVRADISVNANKTQSMT